MPREQHSCFETRMCSLFSALPGSLLKAPQLLRRNPDLSATQQTRYGGHSWVCVHLATLPACFQGCWNSCVLSALLPLVYLSFQANESIVAKTTVMVPNDGGPIEAISTIQTVPYPRRSRRKSGRWNIPVCPDTATQVILKCPLFLPGPGSCF